MKIGLISYGSAVNRYDIAQEYLNQTCQWLKNDTGYDIISIQKIVMDDEANRAAIAYLKQEGIQLLIIQLGTFAQGNMMIDLVMGLGEIPLFVWGFNDPIVESHPTIPLNSLTGMMMMTSYLYKLGRKYSFGYGDFGDKTVCSQVLDMARAVDVKEQLRRSRYAIVGSRVPGFYGCMVDELRFRKELGPEIVYYSLASMLHAAKKQDPRKVEARMNELAENYSVAVNPDMLEKNIRIEFALKEYAERECINALTLKCWPELQELYHCAGCAALSELNEYGITAGCEGDIQGLTAMDILRKMSKKAVFFADLVGMTKSGGLKAWHCGFGPRSLADDPRKVRYIEQATMRNGLGTGIQYDMREGVVTLCGFSEQKDSYKLLVAVGQSEKTDRKALGVQTDIRWKHSTKELIYTAAEQGFGQHYALVHEDLRRPLREFAKWTGMECVEL